MKPKGPAEHFGPSPFSGLSNAAAVAMASALTKSQQPAAATAPPVAGLGTLGQTPGGFGSTGLFGATTTTAPAFGNMEFLLLSFFTLIRFHFLFIIFCGIMIIWNCQYSYGLFQIHILLHSGFYFLFFFFYIFQFCEELFMFYIILTLMINDRSLTI